MRKVLYPLFLSLYLWGLVSCGWSDVSKKAFLDSCNESKRSTHFCNCYLDKLIEQKISPHEASEMSEKEIISIAKKCFLSNQKKQKKGQ